MLQSNECPEDECCRATNAGGECCRVTNAGGECCRVTNVTELRMCEARMPEANVFDVSWD
jgi:hypothetical protein